MSGNPIRRLEPGFGGEPDYSRAIYANPPSHDFCAWLVKAELMRRYHKVPGPLRVKLLFEYAMLGRIDRGAHSISSAKFDCCAYPDTPEGNRLSQIMVANVVNPAIDMMGAFRESDAVGFIQPAAVLNYVEYDYHIAELVDAGRAGMEIPRFRPPAWAVEKVESAFGNDRPVVITLRESLHQPERDSQKAEWFRFAREIRKDYRVVFLPDSFSLTSPIPGFESWTVAALNTYLRSALYHHAFCNLMVSNGPNVWCIFGEAPYLIFKQLVPALPDWDHGQPKGWREQDHMEVGDQYSWASPLQRLAWRDDTCDNILEAFGEFVDTARRLSVSERLTELAGL
jgi:hypothetical protein